MSRALRAGVRPCLLVLTAAVVGGSCTPQPSSEARERQVTAWRMLGSWSGRGSMQTDSFMFETGTLRVRWHTQNEAPAGAGTFRLVLRSAVSGRPLAVAADHRGVGEGESFIPETPRSVYMGVESENVEWSFTVEEGVSGTIPSVK